MPWDRSALRFPRISALLLQPAAMTFALAPCLFLVPYLFLAACAPTAPRGARPLSARSAGRKTPTASASYIGNSACITCHPSEARLYSTSRHAHAVRPMNPPLLGSLAPPLGRIPGTDVDLLHDASGYRIRVQRNGFTTPLTLAMGSGKTGMTYISFFHGSVLELGRSYFPSRRTWYITPGHQFAPRSSVAVVYDAEGSRQCLGCHTTTLPAGSVVPEDRFLGVGCESCHGPGSEHVRAPVRNGDPSSIETFQGWTATRINEMCGRCHRLQRTIDPHTKYATMTNRFQPYGLMRSRCFLESGQTLSCLRCHDPHSDARTTMTSYERVCLQCHGGASHAVAPGDHPGKPCPVNPTRGCISCHMPTRQVFEGTSIPTTMVDHWIRVFH